jgi:hypothetical protein
MGSLGDLEAESRSYLDDFERVLGCAKLWIVKRQAVLGIFEKIKSILGRTGKSNFREQLGTFMPSCTFSLMFDPFDHLLELADLLVASSLSFRAAIDEFVVPMITQQLSCDRYAVAKWQSKVEAASRAERMCIASIRNSALRIDEKCAKMSAQHTISFGSVKEYVRAVRNHRTMIVDVNAKHKKLVEAALAGIDFLKSVLIAGESKMKALLFVAVPVFVTMSQDSKRTRKLIVTRHGNWVVDFQAFLTLNGIVRTTIPNERFARFHFPFDHPLLTQPWAPEPVNSVVIPTAIGVAVAAFQGNGPSELSVKEGDRLFLYERWRPNFWLFVQPVDQKTWGFVPSAVIEVIKARTTFAKHPQLPMYDGQSAVRSGELVIFKSESDGLVVCESADGTEKIITSSVLFET